jgi:hypothetical protein
LGDNERSVTLMQVLVIYGSRLGATRGIAERIARELARVPARRH